MVCQLRRLEQEIRLGRKMEEGRQESVCVCKGGGFRSPRVNFGVFVICTTKAPPWLSMGLWHKMESVSDACARASFSAPVACNARAL